MTKLRPPLSFELALTRVAGLIGWDAAARICEREERTVRDWSDPDVKPAAGDAVTLNQALQLDIAFQAAGGTGAPMLQCFETRLEVGLHEACPGLAAVAAAAGKVAKESGEAAEAAMLAALPGATDADLAIAERQLEEAAQADHEALAAIHSLRAAGGRAEPITAPGGK